MSEGPKARQCDGDMDCINTRDDDREWGRSEGLAGHAAL